MYKNISNLYLTITLCVCRRFLTVLIPFLLNCLNFKLFFIFIIPLHTHKRGETIALVVVVFSPSLSLSSLLLLLRLLCKLLISHFTGVYNTFQYTHVFYETNERQACNAVSNCFDGHKQTESVSEYPICSYKFFVSSCDCVLKLPICSCVAQRSWRASVSS